MHDDTLGVPLDGIREELEKADDPHLRQILLTAADRMFTVTYDGDKIALYSPVEYDETDKQYFVHELLITLRTDRTIRTVSVGTFAVTTDPAVVLGFLHTFPAA